MSRHIKTLLVDDESSLRKVLERILIEKGQVVETSSNGDLALERIREAAVHRNPFDLLITDIHMPKMRGDQLIDLLHREGTNLEILVITGFGDKSLVVELMRHGVSEYLDKPFSVNDFQQRIEILAQKIFAKRTVEEESTFLQDEVSKLSGEVSSYQKGIRELSDNLTQAVDSYKNLMSLPQKVPGIHYESRRRPLNILGGDYVGIQQSSKGCEVLLVDVAGHDMGASYHTVLIKALFESNAGACDGKAFLEILNSSLLELNSGRIVTAVHVQLELKPRLLTITTAAHPTPILLSPGFSGTVPIACWGDPLGAVRDIELQSWSNSFMPGDRLFLYTDGLESLRRYDAQLGRREELGSKGLERLVENTKGFPLKEATDRIWNESLEFARYVATDDLLLLGLELETKTYVQD